jgi:hypothetical protein
MMRNVRTLGCQRSIVSKTYLEVRVSENSGEDLLCEKVGVTAEIDKEKKL